MTRGILSTPASDVAYLVCYKLNFILYTQWTKKQFKTSQVDTILSALAVKVNKIQDAAYIFRMNSPFIILTNQSMKIGRRAWPTRDHGEKSQKQLSSLPVIAGWIFVSEVSLKLKFVLSGT